MLVGKHQSTSKTVLASIQETAGLAFCSGPPFRCIHQWEGSMRRREFITALGGAAAVSVWPLAAHSQQAGVRKIGVLWHAANAEEEAVYLSALREGLAELGHIEGRNMVLENRFPAEKSERFISLAAELARLEPDVLDGI